MIVTNFPHPMSLYPKYVISNIDKLLALGCGELRFELNLGAKLILGVDWADAELDRAKEKENAIVIKCDILDVCGIIRNKSFDAVTLFDVLEHLTKGDALDLLKNLEEKVKYQIILFIPIDAKWMNLEVVTRMQQERKDLNLSMGCHLSTWTPQELDELGFVGEYSPDFHPDKGMGAVFCVKNIHGDN